ncbi:hypothetical protein F4803DRAFT_552892 [Xylaria telfairii]|nr:hypothetical protein F4803DRAFT_552892 [Xylaria telfairii]
MKSRIGVLIGISALATSALSAPLPPALSIIDIQQVLGRFSAAVDTKKLDLLDAVFCSDATADFKDGSGVLHGRQAIKEALRLGQANAVSQHYLSTITVDIDDQRGTAYSRSYLAGVFFEGGAVLNETLTTYGL